MNESPCSNAVTAMPNPADTVVIYKAQSILTMGGQIGPVLDYNEALDVIRWAEQNGPVQ